MTIEHVRLGFAALVLLALAAAFRHRADVTRSLREFFFEPSSAINLALLRVVLFWMLLGTTQSGSAAWYATLPRQLAAYPPGWGWLRGTVPIEASWVAHAETLLGACCVLAILGILTRITVPVAALLAVVVAGLPNFYLKIDHSNHAVVLCALILAASACGDALSLDRLWRARRGEAKPQLSVAYTIPVRFCWLILGTTYLFPGLWKLWVSGDQWISGLSLMGWMYEKWAQLGNFSPVFRLDEYPRLMSLAGTWTLVFEIGFFFALFHRATRVLGAFCAVVFHVGVMLLMNIVFHPLLPLVLLLDFPHLPIAVAARLPRRFSQKLEPVLKTARAMPGKLVSARTATREAKPRSGAPAFVVGGSATLMMIVAGLVPIDSWPIAVYPRFSKRHHGVKLIAQSVDITVSGGADAPERSLTGRLGRLGSPRTVRLFREMNNLRSNPTEFRQYAAMIVRLLRDNGAALDPGDSVTLYRERWLLFPLGERTAHARVPIESFVVTDDLSLAAAPPPSGK
jgi:hypothetical protein